MANNNKKIDIGIGFKVDKTELNNLKTELGQLQNMSLGDLTKITGTQATIEDLNKIKNAAGAVQSALEKSFNARLNTQDLTKFNAELKNSGYTIQSLRSSLETAGIAGQNAFRNITTELLTTNRQLRESNGWLDKMSETMANTVRWTVASSALNAITGSVQKAYGFTKQLDGALNDIRIVTGKSADQMADFAIEANKAAKSLGSTTKEYVKAALIYEQQGLGAADVQARSDVTTKVANVTGQNAQTVSEQLTAIWNGYKVSAAEAELYIDKVSAVAATTAADLEELSEGMGKVASAANSMGVDIDQLNASLATIISVTRQDASSVGTALKTIYARMGDLAVDGEDEFGVKLGDVSGKLQTMGIQILDAQGQMREMGDVIEEVAAKWDTWTSAQQQAAAVALAGKRQYNNLIALFENWDMYESAKSTSAGGAGELQKQQDIYMESMQAHLNQLKAETEELYDTLLDPEGINPMIDALTNVVGLIENVVQGLGGGAGLLTTFGAIGLNVFDKQITKGVVSAIHNISGFRDNLKQTAEEAKIIEELGLTNIEDEGQRHILEIAQSRLEILGAMSQEEYNQTNIILKQTNELYKQRDALKEEKASLEYATSAYAEMQLQTSETTGEITNAAEASEVLKKKLGDISSIKAFGEGALSEATANLDLVDELAKKKRSVSAKEGVVTRFQNTAQQDAASVTLDMSAGGIEDPNQWEDIELSATVATEGQEKLAAAIERVTIANTELAEIEAKVAEERETSNNGIQAIIASLDKQVASEALSVEEKKELLDIQKDIAKAYGAEGNLITDNKDTVLAAVDAIKRYNGIMSKQEKELKKADKALGNYNKELKKNEKQVDEAEESLKKLKQSFNLTKAVKNVTDLAGGIANVASGISTLQNLGSVWNDEDLTAGEKFLQTMTALSFGLPMVINGFATMRTALTSLSAPLIAKTTLTSLDTLATSKNIDKQKENALWSTALEQAKNGLTKEEYEAALAALAEGKAIDANTKEKIKSILGDQAKTLSLKTLAGAALTAAKAIGTATAAFFASPIGWIILAVTAAIAAIASMIHLIQAYTVTEEEAYNSAKKRQEELAQSLEETQNAYEELKSSIEDYKSARDGLEELTVGTTEWKEALAEANSQALQLLQTYPELAKYIVKDAQGLITISDEGLSVLADQQLNELYKAQSAALIGNSIFRDASQNFTMAQRAEDFGINKKQLDAILSLETDTILDPEKFENNLKDAEINIKDEELRTSLFDNREALVTLKNTVEQTNTLLAIEGGEITSNYLKRYGYSEGDSSVLGGIVVANSSENLASDIETRAAGIRITQTSFEDWTSAMGVQADKNSFKYDAWNNQVKYTQDGQEKVVSADQFKKELATHYVYFENIGKYLDTAKQVLTNIGTTTTRETNNIIRSVFASNRAVTKDQIEDFNTATLIEIQKVLDNEAELLTDGQEAILKETKANLDNSLKHMSKERGWFDLNPEDTISPIQDALVTVFNSTDWTALINSGVNYSALSGLGDVLSRIRVMEGEAGLQNIITFLDKFEDPAAFIESIDWTSETLGADIGEKMHELGMEVDFTDEVTEKAILHFTQLTDALETTAERAANTKKIIDGLEYGDSISEEDYKYLQTNYGSLIDSYFTQMEDGTAILTSSAWSFYEAYHALEVAKRKNAAQSLKTDLEERSERQKELINTYQKTALDKTFLSAEYETAKKNLKVDTPKNITLGNTTLSYDEWVYKGTPTMSQSAYTSAIGSQLSPSATKDALQYYMDNFNTDEAKFLRKKFGDELSEQEFKDAVQGMNNYAFRTDSEKLAGKPMHIKVDQAGISTAFISMETILDAALKNYDEDVRNSMINKEDFYRHSAEQIQTMADDAAAAGFLDWDTEEGQVLKNMLSNQSIEDFKIINGSSAAYDQLILAIKATEGSTETLQQELLGLLQTATDQTEFEEFSQYIKDTYGDILDQTTIDEIIHQGQIKTKVNFDQTATDRYNKAIDNLTNSYERLGREISQLEQLMEMTTGEKRLEYLDQINQKILEQNKLLAAQEKYSRSEIRRQLTFGTNTTNDTEGIADNTQVESALKRLMVAYGFATEDNVEAMSLETIFAKLGLNYQGTLTEELYNQLLTIILGKNSNLNGDQWGAATEAANTIITVLGTVFDTISDNAEKEFDSFLQYLENNIKATDLRIDIAIETKDAQNEYNDFIRSLHEDNAELIAETYLQDFSSLTAAFNTTSKELVDIMSKGTFTDEASKDLWDQYSKYGRISKKQYEALSAEDKARMDAWGLTETTWYNPGSMFLAGSSIALDRGSVEGYTFDTNLDNYLTAAAKQAKIKELISSLMEQGLEAQEILDAYADNIVAYHDKVNEAYDKYVDYIDSANSALEHQKELYELLYGEDAIDRLDNYYASQRNNAGQVKIARWAQYQRDLEDYNLMLANASNYTDEMRESITEQYLTSSENYFQSLNDLATKYQEEYIHDLELMFRTMEKDLFGNTLSKLKEEFDWLRESEEDGLNELEAAFAKSSLEANFTKAIASTTDLKTQQKINELREEELALLNEKTNLTQYDIDRANKRLEILQAEIDLQDALNNKTQMRLVRGADGGYSYQYVANLDDVTDRTEKLNNAQKELVQLDEDALQNSLDKAYELYEDWYNKVIDMARNGEDWAAIDEMTNSYVSRFEKVGTSVTSVIEALKDSANDASGLLGINDNFNDIFPQFAGDFANKMGSAMTDAIAKLQEDNGFKTLIDNYQETMFDEETGIMKQLEDSVSTYVDSITGKNGLLTAQDAVIDSLEGMSEQMQAATTQIGLMAGALETWEETITEKVGESNYAKTNLNFIIKKDGEDSWSVTQTPVSAATGMYTGEWGDEGKLAILHEKELVLNKTDTKNILDAVTLTRDLSGYIHALSASISSRLETLSSGIDAQLAHVAQEREEKITQEVNIQAEFPNATDKNQIKEAFTEILQEAEQMLYENTR